MSGRAPNGEMEGLQGVVVLSVERVHLCQLRVQRISRVVRHRLEQPKPRQPAPKQNKNGRPHSGQNSCEMVGKGRGRVQRREQKKDKN